ncbi:MAG: hypothetical protein ACRDFX_00185 [Chloroflexota bacterium]
MLTVWRRIVERPSFRHALTVLLAGVLALFSITPAIYAAGTAAPTALPASLTPRFINVQVSHDTALAHSEPAIAENPVNSHDLVAGSKLFTDTSQYLFKIGTFFSTNGGRTWQDNGLLPGFDSYVRVSDISFAYSPNGSLVYACVLAQDDTRSGIFVSRSRDGGKTWLDPVTVFQDTSGATFSDKPWITVDQTRGPRRGTVYVAWNLDSNATSQKDPEAGKRGFLTGMQTVVTPPPGIVVAHSVDYGHTFSAPVNVNLFSSHSFSIGAIPAVGPDGELHVAYLKFKDAVTRTGDQIDMVSSSNGGLTFGKPRLVTTVVALPNHLPNGTFRNLSLPTFAISPASGALVVAWSDKRFGDADILAVHSTNRGVTWSLPVRVNHDRMGDGKDQFQPAIASSANGDFTCSWFDRRFDPGDRLIDVVVAQSINQGQSFGRNIRVTQHSWNPAIDAPLPEGNPKNTFIGDYQALAVDNQAVHPLWNDTQNDSSQEIRTAVLSETVFARR